MATTQTAADNTRPKTRAEVERDVQAIADDQDSIVSRQQLYAAEMTRHQVRAHLAARRWRRTGRQTIAVTTGPLTERASWWVAVFEVAPGCALDGVTALLAAGLTGIKESVLHVATAKSSRPRKVKGVRVHETRRFRKADVMPAGIPRIRPPVAVVHACLWAASDKQAAMYLAAAVQQNLARPADIAVALRAVKRHRRRTFLALLVRDVSDGAQALGELELTRALRRRGLPMPSRQTIRTLSTGRVYLDVLWEAWGICLEIDGVGHEQLLVKLADVLRDLEVAAQDVTTIRIPLLVFRVGEEAVLDALEALLRRRGWNGTRLAA